MACRWQSKTSGIASAGILIVILSFGATASGDEPRRPNQAFSPAQLGFFESEVKPILTRHCVKCHGARPKIRGGFRLDSREALLRGGDLGPAAAPGDPASSLLVKAINYVELEMPPAGKLPPREIEILTRWVKEGLPWTPHSPGTDAPPPAETRRPPALSEPSQTATTCGLVTPPADPPRCPDGQTPGMVPHPHRRVHPRTARGTAARARCPRRSNDADPPPDL